MTYWPKDLRQEGVGTNCHNAGLGEVGTDPFIQIHHLLQLLDCLQWEDPASNLPEVHGGRNITLDEVHVITIWSPKLQEKN